MYFEYFRKDFGLDDNEETRAKFSRLAEAMLETGSKRDENKIQKLGLQMGWVAHKIDVLLDQNELPESYFKVNPFWQGQGYADPNECVVNLFNGLREYRVDMLKNAVVRQGYRLCRKTVHEGVVKQ